MSVASQTLPNNIDAEQALLGILINDIDVLSSITHYPLYTDFFLERHRLIAKTIYDLADNGKEVDIITVAEALRSNNTLEKIGSAAYLSELTDKGFSSHNIEYYINIIIEKSQRRSIIQLSLSILSQAKDESVGISSLIEQAEKDIFSITDRVQGDQYHGVKIFLEDFIKSIDMRKKNTKYGEYYGIPSGYPTLDNLLTGFHNGELIVLAARPSRGKTAFALNIVHHIAIEAGISTAFFSLEMSGSEIVSRIVCMRTGMKSNKIRQNMLSDNDMSRIIQSFGSKFNTPLYISDVSAMNVQDLRIQSRRLVAKEQVKIIFVDYLGLIGYQNLEGGLRNSHIPRFEKFSEISKALKALARELEIPIVVLSQLNRESEKYEPTLANIRESGAIEQDADVVMMLHRVEGEPPNPPLTKLIISKQRNGPIGDVWLSFDSESMRFNETTKKTI